MTQKEQEHIKQKGYKEAMHYIANAKDDLKLARRNGRYFDETKYVSSASGIAYRGVLKALDTWLQLKGVEIPKNFDRSEDKNKGKSRTIDFYRTHLAKMDKKLLGDLNAVYWSLHLLGYYDCCAMTKVIDEGFEVVDEILKRIEPAGAAQ
ncbi:MAG: DUF5618 family protein [Fibromonadaceae bacterium]|jgi:hypothetical protein|nr:DUF5618 family protein [Fibromonadaceae bacterium]